MLSSIGSSSSDKLFFLFLFFFSILTGHIVKTFFVSTECFLSCINKLKCNEMKLSQFISKIGFGLNSKELCPYLWKLSVIDMP